MLYICNGKRALRGLLEPGRIQWTLFLVNQALHQEVGSAAWDFILMLQHVACSSVALSMRIARDLAAAWCPSARPLKKMLLHVRQSLRTISGQ